MVKFCDNPLCNLHIDVSEAIQIDGYMLIETKNRERKRIYRHEYFNYRDTKIIHFCDTCLNVLTITKSITILEED